MDATLDRAVAIDVAAYPRRPHTRATRHGAIACPAFVISLIGLVTTELGIAPGTATRTAWPKTLRSSSSSSERGRAAISRVHWQRGERALALC